MHRRNTFILHFMHSLMQRVVHQNKEKLAATTCQRWINSYGLQTDTRLAMLGTCALVERQSTVLCIFTTPDVEKIERNGLRNKRPFFFFNKYFLEWNPIPMDRMEERLVCTNIEKYKRDCFVGNFYIPSFTT